MAESIPSIQTIGNRRKALDAGAESPSSIAARALANSNGNSSHNTYLWQDSAWTQSEAARVEAISSAARTPLWGLPVSVKDCFDLAGSPTTCGTHFYRDLNGVASRDSWLVAQLRAAGAIITGKTHLHPIAYGITGENAEYGDCLQPRDPTCLTGGSSSGAAASIQEGSAVFAIGTDTGGSIRVPAALCGLTGYRASLGRGDWRGGAHLAESFDTMGFLFRDPEDAPLFASLFAPPSGTPTPSFTQFAVIDDAFLYDCDPAIVASLHTCTSELESLGLRSTRIDVSWWADAFSILAPIQASEAACIHAGHFDQFEPSIRDRLKWGASLPADEVARFRERHQSFRARMDELFAAHQLILLPASPVTRLTAGADHSQTRSRLLRYTSPFSLTGSPVMTIPCAIGGMQLAAPLNRDEALLQLAARLGAQRKANSSSSSAC
jgi:Asp-tRNA(Asn)/Glu-tRNA(Gln) amidotransferase A subunit family amidase